MGEEAGRVHAIQMARDGEWEELVANERNTVAELTASLETKERELNTASEKLLQVDVYMRSYLQGV